MKPRITLITLGVDDLETAVAFYRDGLGLPTQGIVGREFEHGAVAFFELQSGLKLALLVARRFGARHPADQDAAQRYRDVSRSQCWQSGRSGCGDGTSQASGGQDREARRNDLLGRVRWLFPGSRRALVGNRLEPPIRDGGIAWHASPGLSRGPWRTGTHR